MERQDAVFQYTVCCGDLIFDVFIHEYYICGIEKQIEVYCWDCESRVFKFYVISVKIKSIIAEI